MQDGVRSQYAPLPSSAAQRQAYGGVVPSTLNQQTGHPMSAPVTSQLVRSQYQQQQPPAPVPAATGKVHYRSSTAQTGGGMSFGARKTSGSLSQLNIALVGPPAQFADPARSPLGYPISPHAQQFAAGFTALSPPQQPSAFAVSGYEAISPRAGALVATGAQWTSALAPANEGATSVPFENRMTSGAKRTSMSNAAAPPNANSNTAIVPSQSVQLLPYAGSSTQYVLQTTQSPAVQQPHESHLLIPHSSEAIAVHSTPSGALSLQSQSILPSRAAVTPAAVSFATHPPVTSADATQTPLSVASAQSISSQVLSPTSFSHPAATPLAPLPEQSESPNATRPHASAPAPVPPGATASGAPLADPGVDNTIARKTYATQVREAGRRLSQYLNSHHSASANKAATAAPAASGASAPQELVNRNLQLHEPRARWSIGSAEQFELGLQRSATLTNELSALNSPATSAHAGATAFPPPPRFDSETNLSTSLPLSGSGYPFNAPVAAFSPTRAGPLPPAPMQPAPQLPGSRSWSAMSDAAMMSAGEDAAVRRTFAPGAPRASPRKSVHKAYRVAAQRPQQQMGYESESEYATPPKFKVYHELPRPPHRYTRSFSGSNQTVPQFASFAAPPPLPPEQLLSQQSPQHHSPTHPAQGTLNQLQQQPLVEHVLVAPYFHTHSIPDLSTVGLAAVGPNQLTLDPTVPRFSWPPPPLFVSPQHVVQQPANMMLPPPAAAFSLQNQNPNATPSPHRENGFGDRDVVVASPQRTSMVASPRKSLPSFPSSLSASPARSATFPGDPRAMSVSVETGALRPPSPLVELSADEVFHQAGEGGLDDLNQVVPGSASTSPAKRAPAQVAQAQAASAGAKDEEAEEQQLSPAVMRPRVQRSSPTKAFPMPTTTATATGGAALAGAAAAGESSPARSVASSDEQQRESLSRRGSYRTSRDYLESLFNGRTVEPESLAAFSRHGFVQRSSLRASQRKRIVEEMRRERESVTEQGPLAENKYVEQRYSYTSRRKLLI